MLLNPDTVLPPTALTDETKERVSKLIGKLPAVEIMAKQLVRGVR